MALRQIVCPHCSKSLKLNSSIQKQLVACPSCNGQFQISAIPVPLSPTSGAVEPDSYALSPTKTAREPISRTVAEPLCREPPVAREGFFLSRDKKGRLCFGTGWGVAAGGRLVLWGPIVAAFFLVVLPAGLMVSTGATDAIKRMFVPDPESPYGKGYSAGQSYGRSARNLGTFDPDGASDTAAGVSGYELGTNDYGNWLRGFEAGYLKGYN